MTKTRCCILYNQPGKNALPDELDVISQVEYIEQHLSRMGIDTYRKGITTGFMAEIAALAEDKPDFVFNLAESIDNKGELCYFIPALLALHSLPYSGNPLEAMFITTSKVLTDKILKSAGINSPGVFCPSQHSLLKSGSRYIIKPVWEDGSLGITSESVFTYFPGYEEKLAGFDDSHWLIQDYIEGREFNITVIPGKKGPEVMPPAEMIFRNFGEGMPKIVDFRAKWIEGSFEYKNTVRRFPGKGLDKILEEKLRSTALKCWHVFGLKGYARIDIRTDASGEPFVIEVNANPCLSPDSGVVAAIAEAGLSFTDLLLRIINDLNR